MLAQKTEVVSTTSHTLGPLRGLCILCQNPESFLHMIRFQLLFLITSNSNAYKLDKYHHSNKNGVS